MTKAFEEGMSARERKEFLVDNPYIYNTRENKDWANGWKLEDWRIRKNAIRKEASGQIQAYRDIWSDAESTRG
jgi:hypothetical protein